MLSYYSELGAAQLAGAVLGVGWSAPCVALPLQQRSEAAVLCGSLPRQDKFSLALAVPEAAVRVGSIPAVA